MTQLFSQVLGGTAATIDTGAGAFSTNGNNLLIYGYFRSNRAASLFDDVALRFNNDSGANYTYWYLDTNGGTASVNKSVGATGAVVATGPGATAAASVFGVISCAIPQYSGTTGFKASITSSYNAGDNSGASNNEWMKVMGGLWTNTAAITRVTAFLPSGNSFVAGSSMSVYMV